MKNKIYNLKLKFAAIFLIVAGIIVPQGFSSALGLKDVWKYVYLCIAWILKLVLYITTYGFALVGKLFNVAFHKGLEITNLSVVGTGWSLTRDVLNMFFVISLLIIAFATILRIESYQYKVLLPKLVYAALLVNFSRTIATVFVDFSNVLMKTLLGLSQGSIAETYAQLLFGSNVLKIADNVELGSSKTSHYLQMVCVAEAIVIVLIVSMSIALLALTFMMVIRAVVLIILIILSPAAFVLNILPITQQYAKRWWDEFLKYIFYGPIAAFCIYLSVLLTVDVKQRITPGAKGFILGAPEKVVDMLDQGRVFGILVIVAFLYMAFLVIQALSPMAAGMAMGVAKKGGRLARSASWGIARRAGRTGVTGGGFVGRAVGRRVRNSLRKGNQGLLGRGIGGVGGLVGGAAGAAFGKRQPGEDWRARAARGYQAGRGAGNITRFLDPETSLGTYRQIREAKDKRILGQSQAWMRNKLKPAFDSYDRRDYADADRNERVEGQMSAMRQKSPELDKSFLVKELMDAPAGSERQEAALRHVANKDAFGDVEEVIQKMNPSEQRKALQKLFPPSQRGKARVVDFDYKKDMMTHILGGERAARVMADVATQASDKGNLNMKASATYDPKSGRIVMNSKEGQAKAIEGAFATMTTKQQLSINKKSFANVKYETQKDGTKKKVEVANNGLKKIFEKGSFADGTAAKVGDMSHGMRKLMVDSKEDLMKAAQASGNDAIKAKAEKILDAAEKSLGKAGGEAGGRAEREAFVRQKMEGGMSKDRANSEWEFSRKQPLS